MTNRKLHMRFPLAPR